MLPLQVPAANSGQVAVGDYNLQVMVGDMTGGEVNINVPGQKPRVRARSTPVDLRPRPFPGLLDRETEVREAVDALGLGAPVEVYGEPGLGKTSLLRHLAYHPAAQAFSDGIVYGSARRKPLEDVLQFLFEAFCQTDGVVKATEAEIRHTLADKRVLILLDDVTLEREEVETLLDVAPNCTFILSSTERHLWNDGRALALHGLPAEQGIALIERELGRPLDGAERQAAPALCQSLSGHPLRLLQLAADAREEGHSLVELARKGQTPQGATTQALSALDDPQKRLLATLAALGGATLPPEHLAAIAGLANISAALNGLQARSLAQSHSPRYNLTGTLANEVGAMWDLNAWAARALAHFVTWTAQNPPEAIAREWEAILAVLRWGVGVQRWSDVLRLSRAVEGALALSGLWGAWAQMLDLAYRAAQALNDRAAVAWLLHQQGTRDLCLGDRAAARAKLSDALGLRESLGDRVGAARTRHNLDLLLAPPRVEPPKPPVSAAGGALDGAAVGVGLAAWLKWLIIIVVLAGAVGGGAVIINQARSVQLWVINRGCGELVTPPWAHDIPGIEVFEAIPPGGDGVLRVPRALLGRAEVHAERHDEETIVILRARVGTFEFPVGGGVTEALLDGRSVLHEAVTIGSGAKHELLIICE